MLTLLSPSSTLNHTAVLRSQLAWAVLLLHTEGIMWDISFLKVRFLTICFVFVFWGVVARADETSYKTKHVIIAVGL